MAIVNTFAKKYFFEKQFLNINIFCFFDTFSFHVVSIHPKNKNC